MEIRKTLILINIGTVIEKLIKITPDIYIVTVKYMYTLKEKKEYTPMGVNPGHQHDSL